MQQHSKLPQSRHWVFPGSVPAGFEIVEMEVEGRTKLMGVVGLEVHIFGERGGGG